MSRTKRTALLRSEGISKHCFISSNLNNRFTTFVIHQIYIKIECQFRDRARTLDQHLVPLSHVRIDRSLVFGIILDILEDEARWDAKETFLQTLPSPFKPSLSILLDGL